MRLSDFILLNETQKKGTLLHEGVLIGKRSAGTCIVFLFHLDGYYVESYCNTQTKSVEQFHAFVHPESLHPYLDNIQLDDLLN